MRIRALHLNNERNSNPQYRVSAELRTGKAKEPPFNIPKSTKKEKRAPPQVPAEQTGKPPDSSYFRANNNVVNDSAVANDGGAVEVGTKPSGPPRNPTPKPSRPPPVSSKKEGKWNGTE